MSMQEQQAVSGFRWWEPCEVPVGEARRWRIGALELFVARTHEGWLVQGTEHARGEAEAPPLVVAEPIPWEPDNSTAEVVKYKLSSLSERLELRPALADRPVVSRPRMPFSIVAGARTTVYVGTPLWLELRCGDDALKLCELPLMRPPQTWFGSSTWEGELCYAGWTHCRTDASEIPLRPWRAITPLRMVNQGDDGWLLDRVVLPVPQLPLFAAPDGRLWTSGLDVSRDTEGNVGDIEVHRGEPVDAGPWTELARPRRTGSRSLLGRFYGKLF